MCFADRQKRAVPGWLQPCSGRLRSPSLGPCTSTSKRNRAPGAQRSLSSTYTSTAGVHKPGGSDLSDLTDLSEQIDP